MHHGVDVIVAEYFLQKTRIARVANDEFARGHGCRKARGQVIERYDVFFRLSELAHNVAADISGSARH